MRLVTPLPTAPKRTIGERLGAAFGGLALILAGILVLSLLVAGIVATWRAGGLL